MAFFQDEGIGAMCENLAWIIAGVVVGWIFGKIRNGEWF